MAASNSVSGKTRGTEREGRALERCRRCGFRDRSKEDASFNGWKERDFKI